MRCNYCLGDDMGTSDLMYEGTDENDVPVKIYFHRECWRMVQATVLTMICKGRLDIREGGA